MTNDCEYKIIKSYNCSIAVVILWNKVINSAFAPQAITELLQSGWTTIEGTLYLVLMSRRYKQI
ncbi:MAG: hypothetical protein ACQJCO_03885 [cyanobacterium endosymbiont of Rhopalodia sterrenbergii]